MADNLCVDADPVGDLVLVSGPAERQQSVRVSSKILSVASPVFATMFGPRFAEGQNSGTENWTVSLPDDDPTAIVTICQILHFKAATASPLSIAFIERVAEASEKYDVTGHMKSWTETALSYQRTNNCTEKGISRLLKAWGALGSHEGFWMYSHSIIMDFNAGQIPSDHDIQLDCAAIPDNVMGNFNPDLVL